MRRYFKSAVIALLAFGLVSSARAETGEEWMRLHVAQTIVSDATLSSVMARMSLFFDQADIDMKGVSQESYDHLAALRRAEQRAREIARVMRYDLDGDGVVTRQELEIGLSAQARQAFKQRGLDVEPTREQFLAMTNKLIQPFLVDDLNKDGKITIDEMQRAADTTGFNRERSNWERLPLDISRRGDGVVTREDYEAAVRNAFDWMDTDHDGVISQDEAVAARRSMGEIMMRVAEEERKQRELDAYARLDPKCHIPKASANAVVERVIASRWVAYSNAIFSNPHIPAGVVDINVPDGTGPLYLVLDSAQPVIWRILGENQRVETVVLAGWSASHANAGVIGVVQDKVHFIESDECYAPLWQAKDDASSKISELAFGKAPSKIYDEARVGTISLDTGRNDTLKLLAGAQGMPETTRARFAWAYFLKRMPGGLVRIDPAAVVAKTPPKLLPVPPGGAGIAELADSGALDPVGETNVVSFVDEEAHQNCLVSARSALSAPSLTGQMQDLCVNASPEKYVIRRAITFPEAMDTRVYRFELPRDVPKPEGNAAAAVVWQDTGEPVFPH